MPVRSRFALLALVAVTLFGLAPGRAVAQAGNAVARLDSLFMILDTNQRMMGSVTVRKAGRIIYQRTIGYRDSTQAGWVPSDSSTAFRIGSVTKSFTAVLIYQLVDEHKLSLDTKLSKFFPQLPGSDAITIRDLLGHTSGLPDYTQGMDPMVALDRDALLKRIAAEPVQFKPGTKRRYSNSNFLVLGYIIEAVTHSTYSAQLKQRILDPAGLRRTHFGGAVTPAANETRAYFFSGGHWELQPDHVIENAGAAGGIASTTNDLTRFLSALFQGRLISGASLSEMTNGYSDGSDHYGKGLGPFAIPGTSKAGFSHDGSIGAHGALIGYVPEDSLSLALTINGYNYPQNRIFFLVWNVLFGTGAPLPSFALEALSDAAAASFAGVYSSKDYGLSITIRRNSAAMEAQTQGDNPFPLTYIGKNRFLFVRDGILLEFEKPVDGVSPRFTLYQQHYEIPLTRTP